jgi:hypothetical protein
VRTRTADRSSRIWGTNPFGSRFSATFCITYAPAISSNRCSAVRRTLTSTPSPSGLSRKEYEREFDARYRRPGLPARFLGLLYRIVPKVGPLKPICASRTPSPEAERLFTESFRETRTRYAEALRAVGARRVDLANTDLDTGRPSARGEYELADQTYFELLESWPIGRFENVAGAEREHFRLLRQKRSGENEP